MKSTLLLLLLIMPASAKAQEQDYTLRIRIENLRNSSGLVRAALFINPEGYPFDHFKSVYKGSTEIYNRYAVISFHSIPERPYAVSLYHDENVNGEFDRLLGVIPSEGFGVSASKPHIPGLVDFDDALVEPEGKTMTISIKMNYFNLSR